VAWCWLEEEDEDDASVVAGKLRVVVEPVDCCVGCCVDWWPVEQVCGGMSAGFRAAVVLEGFRV
jgi:hypothetical protein